MESNKEWTVIQKEDVFEGKLLAHGLEHLGPVGTPLARREGRFFAFKYIVRDLEQAKQICLEEGSENHVPGVAINEMYFWESGELQFIDDAAGVWCEEKDVPEPFRKGVK